VRTETLVELAGDARFIGWEMHCLGRPVIGERFDWGTADLILGLQRNGRPLLRDRLRLTEGKGLEGPSGLRGFPVCGTFVAAGAGPQDLDAARGTMSGDVGFPIGLTLIEDLLNARCLAPAVEPASRIFRALWGILRPRLMGRDACPPRIWLT
jgi:urease accessory protein